MARRRPWAWGGGGVRCVLPALLGALALGAAGCGFQLRSWDLGSGVDSAYLAANPRNPLEAPLRQALGQAGVALAAEAEAADVVVELLDARRERRSVTVSGQGRAAEYEMLLGVQYRILNGAGEVLLPPQWIERERVFRIDRDNIVGSSEEQALLEREMQRDLVQQILRTLSAAAESGVAAPAE